MSRSLKFLIIFIMFFTVFFGFNTESKAGDFSLIGPETDAGAAYLLVSIFDLRDRESFVQVTNTNSAAVTTHVQIFAVNDNCRENNFFDTYTGNDTHTYNMRDILTNDGAPSGVVLNDGEYGMVVVTATTGGLINSSFNNLIGNFRIVDNVGYEYRTNSAGTSQTTNEMLANQIPRFTTANFNDEGGVIQNDTFIVTISNAQDGSPEVTTNPLETNITLNLDIYNLDEVPFSCPNIIAACIDQNSPLYEELLAVGGASVASFEYGLNEAIPSSKGAPTACPNNFISNGFSLSSAINFNAPDGINFLIGFAGINNGNGRGSMDQFWTENVLTLPPPT